MGCGSCSKTQNSKKKAGLGTIQEVESLPLLNLESQKTTMQNKMVQSDLSTFETPSNVDQLVMKYKVSPPEQITDPLSFTPPDIIFLPKQEGPVCFNFTVGQQNLVGNPGSYGKVQVTAGNEALKQKELQEKYIGAKGILKDDSIVIQLHPEKEPAQVAEKLKQVFKKYKIDLNDLMGMLEEGNEMEEMKEMEEMEDIEPGPIGTTFYQFCDYEVILKDKYIYLQITPKDTVADQVTYMHKFINDNYKQQVTQNAVNAQMTFITNKTMKDLVREKSNIAREILEGLFIHFTSKFPNQWQQTAYDILKPLIDKNLQKEKQMHGEDFENDVPEILYAALLLQKQFMAQGYFQSIANLPQVFQNLIEKEFIQKQGNEFREMIKEIIEEAASDNTLEKSLINLLKGEFVSRTEIFVNAPYLNVRAFAMVQHLSDILIGFQDK